MCIQTPLPFTHKSDVNVPPTNTHKLCWRTSWPTTQMSFDSPPIHPHMIQIKVYNCFENLPLLPSSADNNIPTDSCIYIELYPLIAIIIFKATIRCCTKPQATLWFVLLFCVALQWQLEHWVWRNHERLLLSIEWENSWTAKCGGKFIKV